jgi:hypothetical protein
MRTALIIVSAVVFLFAALFLLTGHARPAAIAASAVALCGSGILTVHTVRTIPRPRLRRGAVILSLLFFTVVAAQWAITELGRSSILRPDPRSYRLMTHATLQSLALYAADAQRLMQQYYATPPAQRQPFGTAARAILQRSPNRPQFDTSADGKRLCEILPSADSELVIRATMAIPQEPGTSGDSLDAVGRLILTAHGGRYVIDR